jgi:hypothetical protein
VPHIVFDPRVPDYWPGPELWASRESSAHAPRDRATSGLIQPPMHAIAVWDIARIARLDRDDAKPELLTRVRALYPMLFAWHRYLAERRDPDGTGMISVYHPWEGTDNTPRWDAALARIKTGDLPPYARTDLLEVESAERPTKAEYDRYLWLVAQLRAVGYDDARARRDHPFLIKDVQCSAIFGAANAALEEIAALIGASDDDRATLARWSARSCAAVERCWDSELDLALDWDERTGEPIRVLTSAGFCVLLVPGLDRDLARRAQACLFGPDFAGAPGLAYPVILSTGRSSPAFRPRAYWRGPAWPVINWLVWRGLLAQNLTEAAGRLREANLALLARPGAGFAEYYEPFTGEPLGSPDQSWTAAVTIDWLASFV